MNEQGEKSGARSAIILMVIVLLVAGYCVEFGLQTLTWIEANHWAKTSPWLRDVPQTIAAPSATAKGTKVRAYIYEFLAPWAVAKETQALTYTQYRFAPGQVIAFYDPDAQLDTLTVLKTSNPLEYQKFANLFVGHPINSNYEMYQAVYSVSPAQLSPILHQRDALRLNVLLIWKLSFGFDLEPEGNTSIYSFDFGKNRGFQFGDPAIGFPVAVRVFDDRDRQFRFIFTVAAGTNAKFTQDDINMVVQSLEPIPMMER